MFERRIPEWLRRTGAPGAKVFAVLGGLESCVRAIVASVFPISAYHALGDAGSVSRLYFTVGLVSLATALLIPWIGRWVRRRHLYTLATLGFMIAALSAGLLGGNFLLAAIFAQGAATVLTTICYNAYLMDYIARESLAESESLRLFYSAAAWTAGPFLGVWLMTEVHPAAPFVISFVASIVLLVTFRSFRLGDGKVIVRALKPAPNPLAFLGRFFTRRRLVAGWTFATVRSCGWVAFFIYVPVFALESGLGEKVGGLLVSGASGFLFLTPLMLRRVRRSSVRRAVRFGFVFGALAWATAATLAPINALATAFALQAAAFFMISLDLVAGLPFLMAVKPSERTEMSAVYSTFRDVSNVAAPGAAAVVLTLGPLWSVFALASGAFAGTALLAARLHPRLGQPKKHKMAGVAAE